MGKYQIEHNDILRWANGYDGPPFHALLTDAPYHLTTITDRFGKPDSAPAKAGVYARSSAGFMGQAWDGLNDKGEAIAFRPETWAALAKHLYPGAFGMAFSGSRTWHRMAVAIEDAGLIIHPTIFMYCFGSGFPKATRVKDNGSDAKDFTGHRYGLQAIKPAVEPIIVFQKPYENRPVDDITATGAGALNIDGGRIGTDGELREFPPTVKRRGGILNKTNEMRESWSTTQGRWPSNLILHHTDACVFDGDWQCPEHCPVRRLGEQGGETSKTGDRSQQSQSAAVQQTSWLNDNHKSTEYPGDSGTAARYFFQAHFAYEVYEQINAADPAYYTAKPGKAERNAGLDSLQEQTRNRVNAGGLENEPRWAPVKAKNIHPTVKSISLTKYLATLLLPPDAYAPRHIMIPFFGSGSEGIGAMLAGWDEVIGIEMMPQPGQPISRDNPDYTGIAEARMAWWSQWPEWGQTDIDVILTTCKQESRDEAGVEQLLLKGMRP